MNQQNQYLKIARLIAGELNNSIDEDDRKYLDYWLNESVENKNIYNEIKKDNWYASNLSASQRYNLEEGWDKINLRIQPVSKLKKLLPMMYKYAAIAILFLGIGYFYQQGFFANNLEINSPSENITLQLENGNIQIINEDGSTKVVDAKGNIVGAQNGNQLVYSNAIVKEKLVYNTLTVPYGKRFKIQLSDGTNVHLNAGTSLKYPVKFIKGENRQVFLNGEAFFDVTSDKNHPFIVNADALNVEVFGTEFNVSAYPEDATTDVVLVEGSVALYNEEETSKEGITIAPGIKGSLDKNENSMTTEKVNTEIYTQWIKGGLVFRNSSFKNISKKLERHYNVKIINSNEQLNNEVFNASFKEEPIDIILSYFKNSFDIEYKIEENTIYIN